MEDDKALSVLTCRVLEASGFSVRAALEGGDALRQAWRLAPDVVLLDLMLPDMTGFEVCEQLKANSESAEIPVIMVTALADEGSRQRGIDAGAYAYVTKPYDPDLLIEMIRKAAIEAGGATAKA
ncbi:MAG TPA: response regulator [Tepidisphaeraceae bacterium]|nr:response regulator [Tepidisphaeraceae bacterium]